MEQNSGFIEAGWCGSTECEAKIKEETKATIRILPLGRNASEVKKCIYCGKSSTSIALFAKAY